MKRTYLFPIFGVFLFTSCCKKAESDSNPDLNSNKWSSDKKAIYNAKLGQDEIIIREGETINFEAIIENVKDGDKNTLAADTSSVKISLTSVAGGKRFYSDSLYSVPRLNAGNSYTWTPKVTFGKQGIYDFDFNLDFFNHVAERDEANNINDILSILWFAYKVIFGNPTSTNIKTNLIESSVLQDVKTGHMSIKVLPSENPSKRSAKNQKIAYFN